jgi:DNA-directed RNA polymerase specialized sigma24 family protein
MGDTGKSNGEPGQAPDNDASRLRWRRRGQPGEAQAEAEQNGSSPALTELYQTHHRSLLRLAALLTGDTGTAEAVVVDSFVALHDARKTMRTCDEALPYLRRHVVARSRSAARHHRPASGDRSPVVARMPGYPDPRQQPPQFENSAVVLALAALPPPQREAVVLTLYLNLTEEQAAAAMRVGQNALRRHLSAGKTALRALLPQGTNAQP